MAGEKPEDLGFSFAARKNGEVEIRHHGRLATTLRGTTADKFLFSAKTESDAALQQLMARLTGHYKH